MVKFSAIRQQDISYFDRLYYNLFKISCWSENWSPFVGRRVGPVGVRFFPSAAIATETSGKMRNLPLTKPEALETIGQFRFFNCIQSGDGVKCPPQTLPHFAAALHPFSPFQTTPAEIATSSE
jgi:hypothetical protein